MEFQQRPPAPSPFSAPPQPAPAPQSSTAISAAAAQLFRAMDGIGTDEKTIHRVLAGKSKQEIAALRAVYADHYGRSLDDDLRGELSGTDREEAQAALSGDPIAQAAAALRNAADGAGTDEQKIHDTLAQIHKLTQIDPKTGKAADPAAREKLNAAFAHLDGRSLDEMLQQELFGSELRIAKRELIGDQAGAAALRLDEAMHGGVLGIGTDEQKINEVLEQIKDKGERDAVLAAYHQETGHALAFDLDRELSGAEMDLSMALLSDGVYSKDGQARRAAMAQIAASRLAIASQGIGTDEEAIFKQFEGVTDPQLRQEIQRTFNEQYGRAAGGRDFSDMIAAELSGNDRERARQVVRDGQMDPAFALKYAMEGIGTDEELIRATLKRCKNEKEIYALRQKYAGLQGSHDTSLLEQDLENELSGRDGFEIKQLLWGAGRQDLSARQQLAFANKAYDFERGSKTGVLGNAALDLFSDSGKMLDVQHHRLQALGGKLADGTATAEDGQRLSTLTEFHQQDVQGCQAARDAIANSGTFVGTTLIGTAVTIGSWGTTGPVLAAVLAGLGGATELGLRIAVQGEAYSTEDLAADLAKTLLSAATAGVAAGPIAQLAAKAASLAKSAPRLESMVIDAMKGGQTSLISGAASGLLDERTYRGPESGATNFIRQVAKSAASGMAASVVSGATTRGLGLDALRWKALGGLPGGAASSTVLTAIDAEGALSPDLLVDALSKG